MAARRHVTNHHGSPRYTSIDQVPSKNFSGAVVAYDRAERKSDDWAASSWKPDRDQWGGNRYSEPLVNVTQDSRQHAETHISQYDTIQDVPGSDRRDSGWVTYQMINSKGPRDTIADVNRDGKHSQRSQDTAEYDWGSWPKYNPVVDESPAPRPWQPTLDIAPTTDPFDDRYNVVDAWVTSVSSLAPGQSKHSVSRHDSVVEGIHKLNIREDDATTIQWAKKHGIAKQSVTRARPQPASQDSEIEYLRQQLADEKQKSADLGRRLYTLENEAVDPGTIYGPPVNDESNVSQQDLAWKEECWDTAANQSSRAIFGEPIHHSSTYISPSAKQDSTQVRSSRATWSIPFPTVTPETRGQRFSRMDDFGITSIHRWGDSEERHTAILRDGVHGTKPLFFTMKKQATFGDILQAWGKRRGFTVAGLYLRVTPYGPGVYGHQPVTDMCVSTKHIELEVRDEVADYGL